MDDDWIIGGDFNAVKKRNERVGHSMANCNADWRESLIS